MAFVLQPYLLHLSSAKPHSGMRNIFWQILQICFGKTGLEKEECSIFFLSTIKAFLQVNLLLLKNIFFFLSFHSVMLFVEIY